MTNESTVPAANQGRRRALRIFALVLVCIAAILGGRWFFHGRFHVTTDDASVAGEIVTVTPQVAAPVARILVEDTMTVHAGDVLVELSDTDLRLTRQRAEADLRRTVQEVRALYAQTAAATAEYASARAEQAVADIERDHAAADYARRQAAAADGGVMGEELAHAEEAKKAAEARLTAAGRRVDAAQKRADAQAAMTDGVDIAQHPRVLLAATALRQALISEAHCKIRAPIDGVVARRSVTAGTLVAAGTPLLSLVPLHSVWVNANFKEAQLAQVRLGQPVELTADLYGSSVVFHGRVMGLDAGSGAAFALLPAQNATGNWIKVVQRVPVRVELDPKEVDAHPLRVGLSMTADVDTADSTHATPAPLAMPAAATTGYDAEEAKADAAVTALIESSLQSARRTPRAAHHQRGAAR